MTDLFDYVLIWIDFFRKCTIMYYQSYGFGIGFGFHVLWYCSSIIVSSIRSWATEQQPRFISMKRHSKESQVQLSLLTSRQNNSNGVFEAISRMWEPFCNSPDYHAAKADWKSRFIPNFSPIRPYYRGILCFHLIYVLCLVKGYGSLKKW